MLSDLKEINTKNQKHWIENELFLCVENKSDQEAIAMTADDLTSRTSDLRILCGVPHFLRNFLRISA